VRLLRQSVSLGHDATGLGEDADLEPLRSREDFKALLNVPAGPPAEASKPPS